VISGALLDGLLSGIEHKTAWLMTGQAGVARSCRTPLGRSSWDVGTEVRKFAPGPIDLRLYLSKPWIKNKASRTEAALSEDANGRWLAT
jgi:hypothetical protein